MEAPMEAASTGPVSAEFPIKEPLGFAYVCIYTIASNFIVCVYFLLDTFSGKEQSQDQDP